MIVSIKPIFHLRIHLLLNDFSKALKFLLIVDGFLLLVSLLLFSFVDSGVRIFSFKMSFWTVWFRHWHSLNTSSFRKYRFLQWFDKKNSGWGFRNKLIGETWFSFFSVSEILVVVLSHIYPHMHYPHKNHFHFCNMNTAELWNSCSFNH